jgi:thymidylate kinase
MRLNRDVPIFAFEGISASGKSSILNGLYVDLSKDYDVALIDCNAPPTQLTESIRSYVKMLGKPLVAESLLIHALNWLKIDCIEDKKDIVLIDRFVLSNLAYTVARCKIDNYDIDREFVRESILHPLGDRRYDMIDTIYIDCDVEVAHMRAEKRNHPTKIFDIGLQHCARESYLEEITRLDDRCLIIDNTNEGLSNSVKWAHDYIKNRLDGGREDG